MRSTFPFVPERSIWRLLIACLMLISTVGCATGPENIGSNGDSASSDSRASSDQIISRPRPDRDIDPDEPDDEVGPGDSVSGGLYGMSAAQFLDGRQARQRIDLDNVDSDLLAAAVFHETNRRRQSAGLPALRHSTTSCW